MVVTSFSKCVRVDYNTTNNISCTSISVVFNFLLMDENTYNYICMYCNFEPCYRTVDVFVAIHLCDRVWSF
jgi:hypothetical protein